MFACLLQLAFWRLQKLEFWTSSSSSSLSPACLFSAFCLRFCCFPFLLFLQYLPNDLTATHLFLTLLFSACNPPYPSCQHPQFNPLSHTSQSTLAVLYALPKFRSLRAFLAVDPHSLTDPFLPASLHGQTKKSVTALPTQFSPHFAGTSPLHL